MPGSPSMVTSFELISFCCLPYLTILASRRSLVFFLIRDKREVDAMGRGEEMAGVERKKNHDENILYNKIIYFQLMEKREKRTNKEWGYLTK